MQTAFKKMAPKVRAGLTADNNIYLISQYQSSHIFYSKV